MSEGIESDMNSISEMVAGDGGGLSMPPAFVFVNPKQHRKYKKGNQDSVDGRSKGARALMSRINRRKMKEELEVNAISEAAPSETERAQKQIGQMKKLGRQKDLQKKRDEAKKKMQSKTKEMDVLMKARLSDFKKKASDQTKKFKKEGFVMENDVLSTATQLAAGEIGDTQGFADVRVGDNSIKMDQYSAKRAVAVHQALDPANQIRFQQMLNQSPETYLAAIDFAVRQN